jgi:hypothetical protein
MAAVVAVQTPEASTGAARRRRTGLQLTRFVAEVSAQVFEAAIDPDRLAAEESEHTPIFHALARRAGDPVEHFRRDPLGAPLPATTPAPPMTRMLLHSVPTDRPEHRRAAGHSRPSHADPAAHRAEEPTGARRDPAAESDAESATGRGGRHRALRSVGSPSY